MLFCSHIAATNEFNIETQTYRCNLIVVRTEVVSMKVEKLIILPNLKIL